MHRLYAAIVGAATVSAQSAGAAALGDLAFMAGYWRGEDGAVVYEDIWMPPRAGTMVGAWRITRDGALSNTEHFLIWEADGEIFIRVSFSSAPYGPLDQSSAVLGPAVVGENAVTFRHPDPAPGDLARFSYRRAGPETLETEVAFPKDDGGESVRTLRFSRAPLR